LFKHKYNVLINDRIEKVVINTETIGRPVMQTNYNTGKKVYNHNITVTFADETTIEMDVLDYINEKYTYEDFVKDENIKIIDVQNKK
jgi:ATP-dependent protease HslVU (ClpYQ) peptidase subunit